MPKDNTREIKDAIVRSHKWGKCDIDGVSIRDGNGGMTAKPRCMSGCNARTYVYRDGKMVLKQEAYNG
jgi:hypothetical protein